MNPMESEDYKRGWYDGYQEAMKTQDYPKIYPPTLVPDPNNTVPSRGCTVCGIEWGTGVWNYVCNHPNCPTRITC